MSPNAGLVRPFPQTSTKAPRKAGSTGAHVAWGAPSAQKIAPPAGGAKGLILMLIARFLARGRPGFQWTVARNVPA